MRSARVIVVPSEGLKRDLARIYPGVADKVTVIRNTVDIAHYNRPSGFDRRRVRERMSVVLDAVGQTLTQPETSASAFNRAGDGAAAPAPDASAVGGAELTEA